MKSFFCTFFFITSLNLIGFSQTTIPQPTRSIVQQANSPTSGLSNYLQQYFVYNNNNLIQRRNEKWNGISWELEFVTDFTLNASGLPIEILTRTWDAPSSSLIISSRFVRSYNTNNQITSTKSEVFSTSSGQWEVVSGTDYTYSTTNKLLETIFFSYVNGATNTGNKSTWTFDNSDRIESKTSQKYVNGLWVNERKENYIYTDGDDRYDIIEKTNWNELNSSWETPNSKTFYIYNQNLTIETVEGLFGSTWRPQQKTSSFTNLDNQLDSLIFESWDEDNLTWDKFYCYYNDYNTDKSILEYRYFLVDFISGTNFLRTKINYDYGIYSTTQQPNLNVKIDIFPNPTVDLVTVNFDQPIQQPIRLTLIDGNGNLVFSRNTNTSNTQISLLNQPSGCYYLHIVQEGRTKVFPILKI